MKELFQTMAELIKVLPDNEALRRSIVFAAWAKIAGADMKSHTTAHELRGTRLQVAVANETWRKQLSSLGPEYIRRLSALVGDGVVTYIEFLVIPESFAERKKRTVEIVSVLLDNEILTPDLLEASRSIRNEEFRKAFLLAAAGSLMYREKHGHP